MANADACIQQEASNFSYETAETSGKVTPTFVPNFSQNPDVPYLFSPKIDKTAVMWKDSKPRSESPKQDESPALTRKRSFNYQPSNRILCNERSAERYKRHRSRKKALNDIITSNSDTSLNIAQDFAGANFFGLSQSQEDIELSAQTTAEVSCNNNLSSLSAPCTSLRKSSLLKNNAKGVRFDEVEVYFFQRSQGFGTVPTKGGTALGMSERHCNSTKFSVANDEANCSAQVVRANDGRILPCYDPVINQRKYYTDNKYGNLYPYAHVGCERRGGSLYHADGNSLDEQACDATEDSSFAVERGCDELSAKLRLGESSYAEPFANTSSFYKSPLDEKSRRRMLRAAGVQVDKSDRQDCSLIRSSREFCGCSCVGRCLPSTCECIEEEICCQNERPSFPCRCSAETCENPNGFVEFNENRVRSHQNSVFIRLKKFDDSVDVRSPSHVYFEDSRVRSTYLSLTPTSKEERNNGNKCLKPSAKNAVCFNTSPAVYPAALGTAAASVDQNSNNVNGGSCRDLVRDSDIANLNEQPACGNLSYHLDLTSGIEETKDCDDINRYCFVAANEVVKPS